MSGEFDWGFSVALVCLGKQADRFATYREDKTLEEKFELASKIKSLTAVGVYYPHELKDIDTFKDLCKTYKLKTSEVTVDIFSEPKFKYGSFTSPSPATRKETIQRVKEAMDAAKEIECPLVNLWPGQDGHDYMFQSNYQKAWKQLIEGVRECAEYRSDVKIGLEYKLKEPRTHLFLSTVGKALLVCNEVGLSNVGVTLDVGHAMMAYENLAESAVLLGCKGKLFNVHLNDNYADWDWDLIPVTTHFLQFLEFLLWLKILKYKGWILMDVFPRRDDPVKVFNCSIKNLKHIARAMLLKKVGVETLIEQIEKGDATEMWHILNKVYK